MEPTTVAASPSLNPSPTPTPTPTASTGSLPTWDWVRADLQDSPTRGEIDNLWTLPGAAVAAWTEHTGDDGGASTLFVSADGLDWDRAPFPRDGFHIEHGTVVDGELTIIGNIGPVENPRRQVWTTRDGRDWTQLKGVNGLRFGHGTVQALVHRDGGWLAGGVEGGIQDRRLHYLLSDDRITWTELPSAPAIRVEFASDGHRIVAPIFLVDPVPNTNQVAWSDDATTWTEVTLWLLARWDSSGVIGATPRGFALGGQRFRREDESSHPLGWWSADGETWQESTFEVLDGPAGEAAPREMSGSDDGLIALGNGDPLDNAIWISDDGRAWQQVTPLPPGDVTAFARDGDAILLAIQPGSGDGLLWRGTARPPSPTIAPAPAVVCEGTANRQTTLTCDKAVAAARAVVGSDETIVSIEFHYGYLPCPPGARCAAPHPNRGYVLFRVADPGGDLIVGVSADEAGTVSASAPRPMATSSAG